MCCGQAAKTRFFWAVAKCEQTGEMLSSGSSRNTLFWKYIMQPIYIENIVVKL